MEAPPSAALLIKYCLSRFDEECGPSVIPAFRSTVSGMCRRLGLARPEAKIAELEVLEQKVIELRSRELKEADPLSPAMIKIFEQAFAKWLLPSVSLRQAIDRFQGRKETGAVFAMVWRQLDQPTMGRQHDVVQELSILEAGPQ